MIDREFVRSIAGEILVGLTILAISIYLASQGRTPDLVPAPPTQPDKAPDKPKKKCRHCRRHHDPQDIGACYAPAQEP